MDRQDLTACFGGDPFSEAGKVGNALWRNDSLLPAICENDEIGGS